MAFTEAQKVDLRFYLGWSAKHFQFDSELEQSISAVEAKPDTEAKIIAQLVELARIDAAIVACEARFKAAQVGSIKLTMGNELALLRSRGRQEVGRTASTMGVEARHDVFSGSLPRNRSTRWGQTGSGYKAQG